MYTNPVDILQQHGESQRNPTVRLESPLRNLQQYSADQEQHVIFLGRRQAPIARRFVRQNLERGNVAQ